MWCETWCPEETKATAKTIDLVRIQTSQVIFAYHSLYLYSATTHLPKQVNWKTQYVFLVMNGLLWIMRSRNLNNKFCKPNPLLLHLIHTLHILPMRKLLQKRLQKHTKKLAIFSNKIAIIDSLILYLHPRSMDTTTNTHCTIVR